MRVLKRFRPVWSTLNFWETQFVLHISNYIDFWQNKARYVYYIVPNQSNIVDCNTNRAF